MLVAIVRRQGESLASLLQRLEHHLERAIEHDELVDEINSPMRSRR
jgi:predicted RNase H-like HicB family nuclease